MTSGNRATLKHLLNDKIPLDQVFHFDTNFVISALVQEEQNSYRQKATIQFIKKLLDAKVQIACASILFEEFFRVALRVELKKGLYSKKEIDRAMSGGKSKIISYHIKDVEKNMLLLNELLSKFGSRRRVILPTEPKIIEKILETRCKYSLHEADAFHLGTMLFGNHKNFISFDKKDYAKVEGINLWCLY
ncbi:MAG: PIN domain-containing protein [Candidatus Omnitrophica bacterium]|nr:PIN domain-containing protein [Candidatus Omnitrophota bacterium]